MPRKSDPSRADEDRLMTVADVARADNCSTKTVRRAIERGVLKSVRIGPDGFGIRVTREAHRQYRERFGG